MLGDQPYRPVTRTQGESAIRFEIIVTEGILDGLAEVIQLSSLIFTRLLLLFVVLHSRASKTRTNFLPSNSFN